MLHSFSVLLLCITYSTSQTSNPWSSLTPSQAATIQSEYTGESRFSNAAFFNNIGNFTILAQQIRNLTAIQSQLLQSDCSAYPQLLTTLLPTLFSILMVASVATGTDKTALVHLYEFMQEYFLIMTMNVVRESCLYEFFISMKTSFFIFFARKKVMKNTNYLKRIFFQSSYFLENTAEIGIVVSILLFLYMISTVVQLMIYRPRKRGGLLGKVLQFFEYGFFIRLFQLIVTPLTYFTFRGMIVQTFLTNTIIFDFTMALLYSFIIITLLGLAIYVINFAPINMADEVAKQAYGALYRHTKFKFENKAVSNEFIFRSFLKISMAAIHCFGYFTPTNVAYAGIFLYGAFTIYVILSFSIDGLYQSILMSFKMILFHILMTANYIFVFFQVDRTSEELLSVSFFEQLFNSIMLIILILHIVYMIIFTLRDKRKQRKTKYRQLQEEPSEQDYSVGFIVNKAICQYVNL